jgi:hypothetical protein
VRDSFDFFVYLCGVFMKRLIQSIAFLSVVAPLCAELPESLRIDEAQPMSVYVADTAAVAPAATDSILSNKRSGIIYKVIDYFTEANKEHPEKTFDLSFIGGPHYSKEAGLGIGLIGSGRYKSGRGWRTDTITPYSNVSLKLDVATGQYYEIGADGYHILPGDRFRLNYDASFYSFADKFWGIGYDRDVNDENESDYKRVAAKLQADFVFCLKKSIFIGPLARFDYVRTRKVERPELFDGQDPEVTSFGLGLTFQIDTRDYPTGPEKGVFFRLDQLFEPGFLGNKYHFSKTELKLAYYHHVWKDGVIASLLHACLTYGDTPWNLLPSFGGSRNMRGYYEGRYRDKDEVDLCVELRQRVWRRNGVVLWIGAGSVFPRLDDLRMRYILPNAGIGYRWEFKKHVNVRLDFGIGKSQTGVNFSINEAF